MTVIYNFTQHQPTQEQIEAGVVEPLKLDKEKLKDLLTFKKLPSKEQIRDRADAIAKLADAIYAEKVMIGGVPFLMPYLTESLKKFNIGVYFAFSQRVSVEKVLDDGSIKKIAFFKHLGFVSI